MFKFFLPLLFVGATFSSTFAQAPSWLHEDSLGLMFGWKNTEILETDSLGKWVVSPAKYVAGFKVRQDQIDELNNWDSKKWLSLLRHRKTTYLANWLLYALTERDATLKKDIEKGSWEKFDRKDEIAYWSLFLKEHTIPDANKFSR